MRALGFDVKKQEVLKILKDFDKDNLGLIDFDNFNKVSKFPLSFFRVCLLLFDSDGAYS